MAEPILLLRPDKAGDAIKTLPALRALQALNKQYSVHILTSKHNASIFDAEPDLTVNILPNLWKKWSGQTLLDMILGEFPTRFSKAINLLSDSSRSVEELLSYIPAERRYSANNNIEHRDIQPLTLPDNSPANRDESLNIADFLSQALELNVRTLLESTSGAPLLTQEDRWEASEEMGTKQGNWVGVCPFAGGSDRSHNLKRWGRFVAYIAKDPAVDTFFLFGKASSGVQLQYLKDRSGPNRRKIRLCFPSSVRTLGAYLARLDGVVAIDSAPLHLALALEVPSIGFLSGGDVARWYPTVHAGDRLVRRGIFNRFPSFPEMLFAYKRWRKHSPSRKRNITSKIASQKIGSSS